MSWKRISGWVLLVWGSLGIVGNIAAAATGHFDSALPILLSSLVFLLCLLVGSRWVRTQPSKSSGQVKF